MIQEKLKKQIEEVLENFDFDKVHLFMVQTGWGWVTSTGSLKVPSTYQLIKEATRLLNEVAEKYSRNFKSTVVCIGGFEASIDEGAMCLKFVVEHTEL